METGNKIVCPRCDEEYELNLDTFSAVTTDPFTDAECVQTECPNCGYYSVTFGYRTDAKSFLYRCHLELEKEVQELRRLIEIHISGR